MSATRILVVEDDPQVGRTVSLGLRDAGFAVQLVGDGETALREDASDYALIILDLILPGRDGIEILRVLRDRGVAVPILILTAKGQIQDRVRGLDAGADDYLTKPFGLEELRARVRALLRRGGDHLTLRVEDLELDTTRRHVARAGQDIVLTNREFELLEFFLRHRNQILSRTMLLDKLWGYPIDSPSNLVDVHVAHLRAKIDAPFTKPLLHTVRGQGYVLGELSVEAPHTAPQAEMPR